MSEIDRLERALAASEPLSPEKFERAPCYRCGYNGPNYYHPDVHKCALQYHNILDLRSEFQDPANSADEIWKQRRRAEDAERDLAAARAELAMEKDYSSNVRAELEGARANLDQARARLAQAQERIADYETALQFYADKDHFMLSDPDVWDTVSDEPQNFWCDEAGTATVEDGSIARAALAHGVSGKEGDYYRGQMTSEHGSGVTSTESQEGK